MATPLTDVLLAPQNLDSVLDDGVAMIGQEVGDKSGISGTAIKVAYKTVNTTMPGQVRHVVHKMLPDVAASLEPFWTDFNAAGGGQFGDYLAKRGDEAARALVSIADNLAAGSEKPLLVKAYNGIRESALRNVEAALPRIGDLAQKYAG